jgi:NADH-quinone oxidoreductase subunit M
MQWWVFWAFFVGFAVKVPMFPFHTWLPDAHTEAPTAGSVVLASVLLKMGTYGFLRFSLPLLPDSAKNPTIVNIMAVLSIIGIVYGALACMMQKDWKKLVAYSSVSHLGFCTLGIFALNPAGISGSIIQQINHGISTGMLFLIVGVVYERRHTREISEYGGLLKVMPVFTIMFLIAALSSHGHAAAERVHRRDHDPAGRLPDVVQLGCLGRGGNRAGRGVSALAVPAHHAGRSLGEEPQAARSVGAKIAVFAPLIVWAFWIGLNPQPYFRVLERPVAQIVERVRPGYYAEHHLANPLTATTSQATVAPLH